MSKKQLSIFSSINRYVTHRGEKVKVDMPRFVKSSPICFCPTCGKEFKNKQGLGTHKLACKAKEKAKENQSSSSSMSSLIRELGNQEGIDMNNIKKEVKNVMNYILSRVVEFEERIDLKTNVGKKYNKGRNHRVSHSATFKSKVIHELQPGVNQYMVAEKYCINQSLVSKWLKEKDAIIAEATLANRKLLPSRHHDVVTTS